MHSSPAFLVSRSKALKILNCGSLTKPQTYRCAKVMVSRQGFAKAMPATPWLRDAAMLLDTAKTWSFWGSAKSLGWIGVFGAFLRESNLFYCVWTAISSLCPGGIMGLFVQWSKKGRCFRRTCSSGGLTLPLCRLSGTFGLMSYVSLLAIFSHATYLILSAVSCASLETNAEICMTQFVECCAKWEVRPKSTSPFCHLLPSKILAFCVFVF